MADLGERIAGYLSDNVALFDCQGDCPDEVALNEELRTPEYCNRCFAGKLLNLIAAAEMYEALKRIATEGKREDGKYDKFDAAGFVRIAEDAVAKVEDQPHMSIGSGHDGRDD